MNEHFAALQAFKTDFAEVGGWMIDSKRGMRPSVAAIGHGVTIGVLTLVRCWRVSGFLVQPIAARPRGGVHSAVLLSLHVAMRLDRSK